MTPEELIEKLASARLWINMEVAKFHPLAEQIATEWDDVPYLLHLLVTTEHRISRIILIQALGRMGDKRAVEVFINSIQGETNVLYFDDDMFRSQQTSGLWKQMPINGQLRHYDIVALTTMEDSLLAIGADAVPALLASLQNNAPLWGNKDTSEKQTRIIRLLGRIGDERATELLLEVIQQMPLHHSILTHEYHWVGQQAKNSLVAIGEPAVPTTINEMRQATLDNHNLRHYIEVLGKIGDHRAIPTLLDLHANNKSKGSIERALGNFKDDRVVNFLLEQLDQATQNHHISSLISSLGKTGDQRATPAILSKLASSNNDWEIPIDALKSLADPRLIPLLESIVFSDKHPINTHNRLDHARRIAVRALAEIDHPDIDAILIRARQSKNRGVRSWARKSLKKRGHQPT